jgi:uncharacterized membrane protein
MKNERSNRKDVLNTKRVKCSVQAYARNCMTDQVEEWPNAGSRVERLTLFSDAIFAFAMTLLAVNIRVPEIAQNLVSSQLNVELANIAPKLIGYGLSFIISASYWVFYHRIFANIKRYDRTLIWLNIAFLFFVVLIPFPSDLIGRFLSQEVSIVIYSTMMAATGFALSLIWLYASRHRRLIDQSLSNDGIKRLSVRTYIMPVLFVISIPASLALSVFTPVLWISGWPLMRAIDHYYRG